MSTQYKDFSNSKRNSSRLSTSGCTPQHAANMELYKFKFASHKFNGMFPALVVPEAKTSPVPVKPTLARSASKKRKDRALTDRKASSDDMNALRSNKDLTVSIPFNSFLSS